MSKFWTMIDAIAYSLNELIDLVLHTILFSFLIAIVFGGTHAIGFAFFFVIPAFILCAPLIKHVHKRKLWEWIIKTPTYTIIGFMVYILSYGIIANNIDSSGHTSTNSTIAFIFLIIQAYWVWSTLKRLSKPPIPRNERVHRKRKRLFTSGVFALISISISITSFSFAFNVETVGEWSVFGDFIGMIMGFIMGLFFLITALIMSTFFFASLLDQT